MTAVDAPTDASQPQLPPGSLTWYATLFSPPEQRARIEAVVGIWFELRAMAERAREPQAVRLRLAWWREELGLLADGQPRHPLTRSLHPLIGDHQRAAALLNELVTGSAQALEGITPENDDELRLLGFRTAGAPLVLLAESLGAPVELALDAGKQVGQAVACARWRARLGPDLRAGRPVLPLATPAVAPDDARLDEAVSALEASAERAAAQARATLLTPEATALRFHRVLLALHADLLQRARRRAAAYADAPAVSLPPLRRLWTAWRAARLSIGETT